MRVTNFLDVPLSLSSRGAASIGRMFKNIRYDESNFFMIYRTIIVLIFVVLGSYPCVAILTIRVMFHAYIRATSVDRSSYLALTYYMKN